MPNFKKITKIYAPAEQILGNGVRAFFIIGGEDPPHLDPFTLFGRGVIPPGESFPEHPHRGFEITTHIIGGAMLYEDFCGHKGVLKPGDMRQITVGKGVVHAEYASHGEEADHFQLHINLKSKDKMCEPHFANLFHQDVSKHCADGVTASVYVGESHGHASKLNSKSDLLYLDLELSSGAQFQQPVTDGWTTFIYPYVGKASVDGTEVPQDAAAVLGTGDTVLIANGSASSIKLVLIAGPPLNEPVVKDPDNNFVMNSQKEVDEAQEDFEKKRNGFERIITWKSGA